MGGILVANRGEIAIRIARAAGELGIRAVCVYARDDAGSLHTRRAEAARELPGEGVAAYLDGEQLIAAAKAAGCTAIHPGYGFLSENAAFARGCAAEGIAFVGPGPELLELFGDKLAARDLAERLGVPVLPGTRGPVSLEEARAFAAEHGTILLKAVAGGGGRGMRAVRDRAELEDAYASCSSEASRAFGDGRLYAERLLKSARHIEVQIAGDGSGDVTHLWERDCGIQRRHQKLVEVTPSPSLAPGLRARILDAATAMARHVRYAGLGTFEFLVADDGFWFIEANPRLQVEHTVTEEITGVDLVRAQIRLALGASLADVGLAETPPASGSALQARVNLETLEADGTPRPHAGTIEAYAQPSGPGVRVDGYGYAGYRASLRYDSLLAKVIARGEDFASAAARARAALAEFQVEGVPTNIPLLLGILRHPVFAAGEWDTTFVATHAAELLAGPPGQAGPARSPRGPRAAPEGSVAVVAPMQAMVSDVLVGMGEVVMAGDRLVALEAMKMEHTVAAPVGGTVRAIAVDKGDLVEEEASLIFLQPDAREPGGSAVPGSAAGGSRVDPGERPDGDWAAEVAEVARRRALALEMGGPEKVARQHAAGRLTARERIEALADPGSFREIGALTGFASYDSDGGLDSLLPANFVAGTALLDGRKVLLGVDDFTVRGGSGDAAIHAKQVYAEEYARAMRLPVVRLLDGASGGGSVKMAQEAGYTYVPVNPAWDAVVDSLSLVPVVSACLGPVVGLGAARLVMSHLAVLVEGIGQLFTAGPPVVLGGTGEDLTKEELGGAAVHRRNGAVERIVATEADAFEVIRRFLSYLPRSVFETPPVAASPAEPDRSAEELLAAVPRNPREPYRIGPIMEAIFDAGSVLPYAEYGGATITALARLDGHPVGVIAGDSHLGATMSAEGAQAVTRLVDLCETFHLPIVSLTDQAGMTIGLAAERRATIRHGARAIAAVYQARVPQAELILRRVYGVGGAGIVNRHRAGRSWAWPSGDWGSLPVQGGIEAAFRAQLAQIPEGADRDAEIARIQAHLAAIASPFRTAERFGVQDIIDPRDSRPLLTDWVRDAYRLLPEQLGRPSFGTRPLSAPASARTMSNRTRERLVAVRFLFSPPAEEAAGLLSLPWTEPLEEWQDERLVEIRQRGISRHIVRFVADNGTLYALKALSERLARREYRLLRALADLGIPAVEVVGAAVDLNRGADAILVTKFLTFATTYRAVFSSPRGGGPPTDKLLDALVELLVRLHLSGFFWGDCSLSNTLFRYDAGTLEAYLVDTETSEKHPELTVGQRNYDVELAVERVYAELLDLEAGDLLPAGVDPLEVAEELQRRYDRLWDELTREEIIPVNEQRFRIAERLRRLNELGFAAEEVELVSTASGNRLRVRTRVAELGDDARKLFLRTGIEAGENQARRLLNDIASFRAYLEQKERRPVSEIVAASRWLTEVYDPVVGAIPEELRGRLAPAEVFHEILEHRWYMSEQAGRDVGTTAAARSYFERVLPHAPEPLDKGMSAG